MLLPAVNQTDTQIVQEKKA